MKVDWLKGTRVLIVAHYIPGPLAAYLLQGLGAEVIKIEPPFGDLMRGLPPFIKGKSAKKISAYFAALNGGQKSVVLNFKEEEGINNFKKLIKNSDILIDGNRAGYLEKILGSKISEVSSDIVHIPITAYGLKGPLRDMAGHDNNLLGLSGVLSYSSVSEEGTPSIYGCQLADITAGYLAALMAVASMVGRLNKQGEDIKTVDVSMLHAASFLNHIYIAGLNATDKSPLPSQELLNGALPNYRAYKTSCGGAVYFGPIEPKLFENFCERVDRTDILKMSAKNQHEELGKLFGSKSKEQWISLSQGCDCCLTPVNELKEALNDSQMKVLERSFIYCDKNYGDLLYGSFPVGVGEDSVAVDVSCEVPEVGQHTQEVLSLLP